MAQVAQFNKMTVEEVRRVMTEKFAEIERETGVKLQVGSISYNANSFKTRVTAVIAAKEGEQAKIDWDRKCIYYGLKSEDFGRTFQSAGITMKLVRIDTKKYKMPIICDGSDGKQYKFAADRVCRLLPLIGEK